MSEAIQDDFHQSIFVVTDREYSSSPDLHRTGPDAGTDIASRADPDHWADLDRAASAHGHQLTVHAAVVRLPDQPGVDHLLLSWSPQSATPSARAGDVRPLNPGAQTPSPLWLLDQAVREITGTDVSIWLHRDDLRDLNQIWANLLENPGHTRELRVRLHHRNTEVELAKLVLTNALHDRDVGAVIVALREVHPLLNLAGSPSHAEDSLAVLLGSTSVGVWVIDAAGRTLDANARVAEMFGVDLGELRANYVWDYLDGRASRFVHEHMTGTTAPTGDYSLRLVSASGVPITVILSSAPTADPTGDAGSTVLTFTEAPPHQAAAGLPESLSEPRDTHDSNESKWSRLTQRERAIVELLIAGERVPAIAAMLYVSNSTVRSQLSSAFHKLGVASQQELIHLLR